MVNPANNIISFRGQKYRELEATDVPIGAATRVGRFAKGLGLGAIGAVSSVAAPFSQKVKDWRSDTLQESGTKFKEFWEGKGEGKIHQVADKSAQKVRKSGYNPFSQKSMMNFVNDNPHRLLSANGHQYILCNEDSAFIFIPNGKKEDICEIRLWDPSSGKDIENSRRLERSARAYMVAYEKIQDSIAEFNKNAAAGKAIAYPHIIIDFHNQMVRVYNNIQPTDSLGWKSGRLVKLEGEMWKDMREFFDPKSTESKQPLKGEKVKGKSKKPSHVKNANDDDSDARSVGSKRSSGGIPRSLLQADPSTNGIFSNKANLPEYMTDDDEENLEIHRSSRAEDAKEENNNNNNKLSSSTQVDTHPLSHEE